MNPHGIGIYHKRPAILRPWDPRAVTVAQQVIALIREAVPEAEGEVTVEHVGSSAVPGCAGKGVIDLLVMYPPGARGLERAKAALDGIGFQRQVSRDPFPEERPMRVGSYAFDGDEFRLHAHVVAADAAEAAEFLAFRDALRADRALLEAYLTEKRSILAAGVSDSADYSVIKGAFIQRWLAMRGGGKEAR